MKNIFAFIFCVVSLNVVGQEAKPEFDGHKWYAPYHLPIPKDWTLERFQIPVSFAPEISYKGVEDIRFAPGWAKVASEEYWTYAFLWYLDGAVTVDEKMLNRNLTVYYAGLYKVNTGDESEEKKAVVTSEIRKAQTNRGDIATYDGIITIMDYMQKRPIKLHCIVHHKFCEKEKKTIVFYELSPKPFSHSNWIKLNQLWTDFRCERN